MAGIIFRSMYVKVCMQLRILHSSLLQVNFTLTVTQRVRLKLLTSRSSEYNWGQCDGNENEDGHLFPCSNLTHIIYFYSHSMTEVMKGESRNRSRDNGTTMNVSR